MINVAVGIIIKEDQPSGSRRVLLCQRKKDARYPLKWEFPGGKLEPNEHPDECLRRELFEEAAGVGLYRDRRRSTERRLEETTIDLSDRKSVV